MKYKGLIASTLFLLAIVCTGCTKPNSDKHHVRLSLQSDVKATEIKGQTIIVPPEFDGIYSVTLRYGNLIYTTYNLQYKFVKANIVNDSLVNIQHFVEKGAFGRDKFQGAGITFISHDEFALLTDLWGHLGPLSYWKVPANGDFTQASRTELLQIDGYNISFLSDEFLLIDKNEVMFPGASFDKPNTIVSTANYDNGSIKSLHLWPKDDFKGEPEIKAQAWDHGAYLADNDNGRYVFAAWMQPYAFLFGIDENSGHAKITKFLYDYPIEYRLMADNLNVQFVGGLPLRARFTSNNKHIYSLLVDTDLVSEEGEPSPRIDYGDIVEVFDWDGNLQRRLHLDEMGIEIFVDETDTYLYLGRRDPKTDALTIRRYTL